MSFNSGFDLISAASAELTSDMSGAGSRTRSVSNGDGLSKLQLVPRIDLVEERLAERQLQPLPAMLVGRPEGPRVAEQIRRQFDRAAVAQRQRKAAIEAAADAIEVGAERARS